MFQSFYLWIFSPFRWQKIDREIPPAFDTMSNMKLFLLEQKKPVLHEVSLASPK